MARHFATGDWVIYRKQKQSNSPGPRAKNLVAARKGESYRYIVEKYWIVNEVLDSGELVLKTRGGKLHTIDPGDPLLRKARWWERWLLKSRFNMHVD